MTRDFKEALRHRQNLLPHHEQFSDIRRTDQRNHRLRSHERPFCLQLAIYPHRIAVRQES